MSAVLNEMELTLTAPAQAKMADLFEQVDDSVQGVRVFATSGGCSGISFGMTFTDAINDDDGVLACDGFKVVVDDGTLPYLRGVEIDFVDQGDGNATSSSTTFRRSAVAEAAGLADPRRLRAAVVPDPARSASPRNEKRLMPLFQLGR